MKSSKRTTQRTRSSKHHLKHPHCVNLFFLLDFCVNKCYTLAILWKHQFPLRHGCLQQILNAQALCHLERNLGVAGAIPAHAIFKEG